LLIVRIIIIPEPLAHEFEMLRIVAAGSADEMVEAPLDAFAEREAHVHGLRGEARCPPARKAGR